MALAESSKRSYKYVCEKFIRDNQIFDTESENSFSEEFTNLKIAIELHMNNIACNSSSEVFYKHKSALLYLINRYKIRFNKTDKSKYDAFKKLFDMFKSSFGTYAEIRELNNLCRYYSKTKKERKKGISEEDFNKLYIKADKKEKAMLEIAISTGIRPAEFVAGATLSVVGNSLFVSIVSAKKNDKGTVGADRVIEVGIDSLKQLCPDLEILKYTNSRDIFTSIRTLQNRFKKLLKKAGIRKQIVFYNFRHQMRSNLAKTLTADEVAQYMGHQSVRSQLSYGSCRSSNSFQIVKGIKTDNIPRGALSNQFPAKKLETKVQFEL